MKIVFFDRKLGRLGTRGFRVKRTNLLSKISEGFSNLSSAKVATWIRLCLEREQRRLLVDLAQRDQIGRFVIILATFESIKGVTLAKIWQFLSHQLFVLE